MNINTLTDILYAVLTNVAIPPHHAKALCVELLENMNYRIDLNSPVGSDNRFRIKASYGDHNGEADFQTLITVDNGNDEEQVPRVRAEYRVGKHIIA